MWLNISAQILYLLVFIILVTNGEINSNLSSNTVKTSLDEKTLTVEGDSKLELCSHNLCVRKCCGLHDDVVMKILDNESNPEYCVHKTNLYSDQSSNLPNSTIAKLHVYNSDLKRTSKVNSTFEILDGYSILRNSSILSRSFQWYLLENGKLLVDRSYLHPRWIKYSEGDFCIDDVIINGTNDMVLWPFVLAQTEESMPKDSRIVSLIGMVISCIFLVATLVVYGTLPKLRRKLHGMIVLAFAGSFLGFFLVQAIHQLVYEINGRVYPDLLCHIRSMASYYLIFATLFWMVIMTFDILLEYRRMTRFLSISKKDNRRFQKYCSCGFGAPLGMVIMFAFFNYLPLHRINDAVITPGITRKSCFLEGLERLLYVFVPMGILVATSFIFLITAASKIHRLEKNSDAVSDRKRKKHRFVAYVKLVLLIAVSLALEVAEIYSSHPDHIIWEYTGLYNYLKGFFIFVIFVCNKRIIKMIIQRCNGGRSKSKYQSTRTEPAMDDTTISEENKQLNSTHK